METVAGDEFGVVAFAARLHRGNRLARIQDVIAGLIQQGEGGVEGVLGNGRHRFFCFSILSHNSLGDGQRQYNQRQARQQDKREQPGS
jgi:hypothetical protein